MKLKIAILICFLLIPVCSVFALGDQSYISDGAELLTSSEEKELDAQLEMISDRNDFDVVVVTVEDLGDHYDARDAAEEIYISSDYGRGNDYDGIMLFFSTEYRDWYMLTCGEGNEIFDDDALDKLEAATLDHMRDGDFYKAFSEFADECDSILELYETYGSRGPFNWGKNIFISIVIGVAAGLLITFIMSRNLKSVAKKPDATNYVRSGSFALTESSTRFLYSNVTRTPKPSQNSSSTRSSSAGRSFGGRGGRL